MYIFVIKFVYRKLWCDIDILVKRSCDYVAFIKFDISLKLLCFTDTIFHLVQHWCRWWLILKLVKLLHILSNIGSSDGLVHDGTKSLPEPLLNFHKVKFQLNLWITLSVLCMLKPEWFRFLSGENATDALLATCARSSAATALTLLFILCAKCDNFV